MAQVLAQDILYKYHQNTPPFDMIAIAQGEGLKVMLCPKADWDGAIDRGQPATLYVNTSNTPTRQRFTAAHLLGHWFLHPEKNVFRDKFANHKGFDYYEMSANRFAIELLMPWHQVAAYSWYGREKGQALADRFGVAFEALKIAHPTLV